MTCKELHATNAFGILKVRLTDKTIAIHFNPDDDMIPSTDVVIDICADKEQFEQYWKKTKDLMITAEGVFKVQP